MPRPTLVPSVGLTSAALLGCVVAGCSTVGVTSIGQGRTPYNEVIQDTAREQTLLNLVRASNDETPLFLDVTEVDQATTAAGTLSGGASQIGAVPARAGQSAGSIQGLIGAVTGSASYTEAPTVRYIPLSGQQLISQVSTPLTSETIVNLQTSDWPLPAILQLGVDRLTLRYGDYAAAVDTLLELDARGAVIVAATQAPDKGRSVSLAGLTFSMNPAPAKDDLTFYVARGHASDAPSACEARRSIGTDELVNRLWERLRTLTGGTGRRADEISLRSKGSVSASPRAGTPPVLQTRSALGISRAATKAVGGQPFVFVPADVARAVVAAHDRVARPCRRDFYALDPASFGPDGLPRAADAPPNGVEADVSRLVRDGGGSSLSILPDTVTPTPGELERENVLLRYRKFMLVVVSDERPGDAFVSVPYRGRWYSILNDDAVSKQTLALVAQFDTIQATASQPQALTPTISVGPR